MNNIVITRLPSRKRKPPLSQGRYSPLRGFIGQSQAIALASCLVGEEGEYFEQMLTQLGERITNMPKTYEQDGKGDEAVVYLHYFKGSCDVYVTEKDKETPDEPGQHQAFGYTDIGYGAELGYVSIAELLSAGVELDLYFTPTTVGELKKAGKIKS